MLYLFRNPLWLFGWVALAAAFVFQALALHNGLVSVVQPLLATELVFMLVLRQFWIHQSIRPITWGAAAVTCVSLTVFVIAGQPGGGQPTPISHRWFTAGLACCAGADDLLVLGQAGVPLPRIPAQEAVEVVETPAVRPPFERSRRALLTVRGQMPLTERRGAVSVLRRILGKGVQSRGTVAV